MKRFLLATVAAVSLGLTAAHAQTDMTEPVPTPPPIQTPAQSTDNPDGTLGTLAQTPQSDTSVEAQITPAPADQAAQNAQPMPATGETTTPTPTFASANSVCQPRVTSVHFGRSSALSQQNRHAIEHAVDAASVCSLQEVVIADTGQGARRAAAVQATLVRQGVPAELIRVDASAAPAEGAATGQLDVRMNFAGVANTDVAAATAAQAPATPDMPVTPEQMPEEPTNEAEDAPAT
jgi:hypothetical protein